MNNKINILAIMINISGIHFPIKNRDLQIGLRIQSYYLGQHGWS